MPLFRACWFEAECWIDEMATMTDTLAGEPSLREIPLTWENVGVEANILL